MKRLVAALVLIGAVLAGCEELSRVGGGLELYEPNAAAGLVVNVGEPSLVCFAHAKLLRFVVIDSTGKVLKIACDEPIIEKKGTSS